MIIEKLQDLYSEWARAGVLPTVNRAAIHFWTHLHSGELKRRFHTAMTAATSPRLVRIHGTYSDELGWNATYAAFDRVSWRPRFDIFAKIRTPEQPSEATKESFECWIAYEHNDVSELFEGLRTKCCREARVDQAGAVWFNIVGKGWHRDTPIIQRLWMRRELASPGEDRYVRYSPEHFAYLRTWAQQEWDTLGDDATGSFTIYYLTHPQSPTILLDTKLKHDNFLTHVRDPSGCPLDKTLLTWLEEELPAYADMIKNEGLRIKNPCPPIPAYVPENENWLGDLLSREVDATSYRRGLTNNWGDWGGTNWGGIYGRRGRRPRVGQTRFALPSRDYNAHSTRAEEAFRQYILQDDTEARTQPPAVQEFFAYQSMGRSAVDPRVGDCVSHQTQAQAERIVPPQETTNDYVRRQIRDANERRRIENELSLLRSIAPPLPQSPMLPRWIPGDD